MLGAVAATVRRLATCQRLAWLSNIDQNAWLGSTAAVVEDAIPPAVRRLVAISRSTGFSNVFPCWWLKSFSGLVYASALNLVKTGRAEPSYSRPSTALKLTEIQVCIALHSLGLIELITIVINESLPKLIVMSLAESLDDFSALSALDALKVGRIFYDRLESVSVDVDRPAPIH